MSSTADTYDIHMATEVEMKTEESKSSVSQSGNATSRDKRPTTSLDTDAKEDTTLYTPLKRPSLLLTPTSKNQSSSTKKVPSRCDQYNCEYWVTTGFCRNRLTTCKCRHDEERRNVWPWSGDLDDVFPDMVGLYSE